MQTQTPKKLYTPEEYLQLEEKSEFKNEYWNGEIVAIAGGTTNHNEIAGNFYANFKLRIQLLLGDLSNQYCFPIPKILHPSFSYLYKYLNEEILKPNLFSQLFSLRKTSLK